jgi:tyrosyl-tRNA synthetase
LHPSDLKATVSKYVTDIIRPIREKIVLTEELSEAIKKTT